MKILNKLTINNLKLNKKRTIVTIIGIILSTALICAVAGVFSSFRQTLIDAAKVDPGDFHVTFEGVPEDEVKYIVNNREVDTFFYTQPVGYSKLEGSANEYKPYLHLMEYDKTALTSYGIKLVEGRLPENSNELIISSSIDTNANVEYKIGDKLTLDIGKRMSEGHELNQDNPYATEKFNENTGAYETYDGDETLEHIETREFTIVGIMERPNYTVEPYDSPGYTVITVMDDMRDTVNISVKMKDVRNTYEFIKDILDIDNIDDMYNYDAKYEVITNYDILAMSGVTRSGDTGNVIFTLIAIVIGIIIAASVFVIRNSFAISVSERMKQIGMIVSVGATKKQIKKSVLFEGVIVGLIGIPIGILCGILATFILVKFSQAMLGDMMNGMTFSFAMPISAVILSIILAIVTIYLSTRSSARKASKVSPIEAIRSNNEIKIKAKKVKSPKIIKKIFGIGGDIAYKNLKRNRSKYRTTVISLVVSITIFISLSTFMNYVFDLSGLYYTDINYDVEMYISNAEGNEEEGYNEKIEAVKNLETNKDYTMQRGIFCSGEESNIDNFLTKDGKEYYDEIWGGSPSIRLVSLGKEPYRKYIDKLGLSYDEVKDKAICLDMGKQSYKKKQIDVININKGDNITGKIYDVNYEKEISLEVAEVTEEKPIGINESDTQVFIVSDEYLDANSSSEGDDYVTFYIDATDADELEKEVNNTEVLKGVEVYNIQKEVEQMKRMIIWISVFLYGFIIVITLIGVTNIFNTITTNMNLRSKEFAMLKSIGMTKKEFNRMINLESIFYGVKSLLIGNVLGVGLSYFIYKTVADAMDFGFQLPIKSIIISIVFVMIVVSIIMRYSLKKINKQNIIETIRKENI